MAMGLKTKYVLGAHLSERKFRELLRLFAADVPALATADLTGLNRNTVNRYFRLFRERITEIGERESPFQGEVELDESYFGARRVLGRRGRGALGKTIVFGLLKRGGLVYTRMCRMYPGRR
jgi:transposase-like protein